MTHTHTHTSGPWSCVHDNDWDGAHVIDKSGRIVADCQGCDIPGTHGEVGTDDAKANARLIAAAPELLAALEAFLRAPSIGSSGSGSSTIVVQDFNLRAARAAIAKAEGTA